MLRTWLVAAPLSAAAVLAASAAVIPFLWVLRDIGPVYEAARALVRILLRVAGIRVQTRGADPWAAAQPCLYVCNHASNVDPPVVFVHLPRVAILAKKAVFRIPLFGYALLLAGFIPVDRSQPASRSQALKAGIERLRGGRSLLVFPEGTRSPDGTLLPFRPGPFTMAIEAQAPVVPITIVGSRQILPRGSAYIRPGRVTLVFHEPIPTRGKTLEDREELMRRVRDAIGSALEEAA